LDRDQFHTLAALATGKYFPVGLAVGRWLSASTEAVWTLFVERYISCSCQESSDEPLDITQWLITVLVCPKETGITHNELSEAIDIPQ
jgi:hypothetical protein